MKKTVRDIQVSGRRVLVRVDYNIPFVRGTTQLSDDRRLRASLSTIEFLREQGARITLCSHLGRPGGQVVEELRLRPVAERLSQLLGAPVGYVTDCIGPEVEARVRALRPGQVLLLENLRFYPEEERNDDTFAQRLASYGDIYVDDAFSAAHRAHASIERVAHYRPAVAGFLMERELEMLGRVLESRKRPLVAILGGAKISDKIAVMKNLLDRVNVLLVGGGMAAAFLKAQGHGVGRSEAQDEWVSMARSILRWARQAEVLLHLPIDVVVAERLELNAPSRTVPVGEIPEGWVIADIGPYTVETFVSVIRQAGTVVWNGPQGVFEVPPFDDATRRIAEALASLSGVTTVIGGGSTAEAVDALGLADRMSHVSTGGGATLEYLKGKTLPGVAALLDAQLTQTLKGV